MRRGEFQTQSGLAEALQSEVAHVPLLGDAP